MSSNGGTENSASYLEKLSTEDIWMIASLCDHLTLVALASTSSHMRFKVLPRIHKKTRFVGNQDSLERQFTDFLGHQTPINPRVYSTISSATISVFKKPEENLLWAGLYASANSRPILPETRRTLPIFEALQAMPNLRSLSLHLKFLTQLQELELYDSMQEAGHTEIQYLRIDSSMHTDHAVKLEQLQYIPPSVKRLAVTLHLETKNPMVWIPSLCVENIRHIIRLNSGLEELILRDSEKNFGPFGPSAIKDGRGWIRFSRTLSLKLPRN
uniref:Uncharacterized protein n=1 Tax=Bionectria ochroleuca TaxID=29856 RepID=A0A8H7TNW4_BIOOC